PPLRPHPARLTTERLAEHDARALAEARGTIEGPARHSRSDVVARMPETEHLDQAALVFEPRRGEVAKPPHEHGGGHAADQLVLHAHLEASVGELLGLGDGARGILHRPRDLERRWDLHGAGPYPPSRGLGYGKQRVSQHPARALD